LAGQLKVLEPNNFGHSRRQLKPLGNTFVYVLRLGTIQAINDDAKLVDMLQRELKIKDLRSRPFIEPGSNTIVNMPVVFVGSVVFVIEGDAEVAAEVRFNA
jgi:hypothetical protein